MQLTHLAPASPDPPRWRALFALLVAPMAACATGMHGLPDGPVLGEFALKQRVFELGSGLRVLVQEDHNTEQVMFRFRVGSGGTADPPGKEGIAHLVEHLAFRNKPGGGQVELWDMQERMGAVRNAFTSHDVTEYFTIVHKDRLPELMQLEAWRLLRTLDGVTEEMFQVERQVVRNELRLRYETTSMNVPLEVFEQLFPEEHILRRATVIGSHASLNAITLDDVRAFVKAHYTPDNITIIVAGDVRADQVQKELGRWPAELLFGPGGPDGPSVPPRPRVSARPRAPVPAPVDTKLRTVVAPVLEPQLVIAWSAPGGMRGDDQDVLAQFAADALNRALSFGIERRPRDDLESIGGFALPMVDATAFVVFASLRPGADPERQRTRILDAVASAWSGDLADFDRVFTQYGKWRSATTMLLTSSIMEQAGGEVLEHYWRTGDAAAYKARLEATSRIESSTVKRYIYDYLRRERAVSVYFEPEADLLTRKDDKKSSARDEQLAQSRNYGAHRLGKKAEISLAGLDGDAILRVTRSPELSKLRRFTLANGLRFVLVPVRGAPVSSIVTFLPGGNHTVEPVGLAGYAARRSFSTCPDHGDLTPVGGLQFSVTREVLRAYETLVLDGNLANGLAVLADELRCRKTDEEAHLMGRPDLLEAQERVERQRKRAQVQASERFARELYPDHPYGRVPEPRSLAEVPFPALDGFVQSHFRPDGALAIVVGDVDEARVRPLAERYFGSWQRGGGLSASARPPAAPAARKILLFDRPDATQSSLSFGCRLAPASAESLPAHQLVGEVIGEELSVLREQWGATYGVYATTQSYPGGVASLVAGGAVETPRTVEALQRLFDLVASTAAEGPSVRAFTLKRWDHAIQWNRHLASGAAKADLLVAAEVFGWGTEVWDRYPENLARTTRAQLAAIIEPCVGREIVTIVGDRRKLEPELRAAGLAPSE